MERIVLHSSLGIIGEKLALLDLDFVEYRSFSTVLPINAVSSSSQITTPSVGVAVAVIFLKYLVTTVMKFLDEPCIIY